MNKILKKNLILHIYIYVIHKFICMYDYLIIIFRSCWLINYYKHLIIIILLSWFVSVVSTLDI